jgi:ribosomal protein L7Ae-like RNA K-turn-binding protein
VGATDLGKVVRLIGLGLRARQVVVGVAQVRATARRGRLVLAMVAKDASPNSRDKVVPVLEARGIAVIASLSAADLGAAVGKGTTAAIGVMDGDLASGIRAAAGHAERVVEEEV